MSKSSFISSRKVCPPITYNLWYDDYYGDVLVPSFCLWCSYPCPVYPPFYITKLYKLGIWWGGSTVVHTMTRRVGIASLQKHVKVSNFMQTFLFCAYIPKHIQTFVRGMASLLINSGVPPKSVEPRLCLDKQWWANQMRMYMQTGYFLDPLGSYIGNVG